MSGREPCAPVPAGLPGAVDERQCRREAPPIRKPTIVAVFAHPDDESYGPAGTLARYAAAGADVHLICATRGEAGRRRGRPPFCTAAELPAVRTRELKAACQVLGIRGPHFLGEADQGLSTCDFAAVSGRIADRLRQFAPQVVITLGPSGSLSPHPDHIAMHKICKAAWEQVESPHRPAKLYCYNRFGDLQEMAVSLGLDRPVVAAIGVAAFRRKKLLALRAHLTQTQQVDWLWEPDADAILRIADREQFVLANPSGYGPDEDDLFAGLNLGAAGAGHAG